MLNKTKLILALLVFLVALTVLYAHCSFAGDYTIKVGWEDVNEFEMVDSWDFEYSFDQVAWIPFLTMHRPDAQADEYTTQGTINTIEGYNYIYVRGRTIDINGVSSNYSEVAKSAFRAGFPFPLTIKSIVKGD